MPTNGPGVWAIDRESKAGVLQITLELKIEEQKIGIDYPIKRYLTTKIDLMIAFLRNEIDKKRGT